MPLMSFNFNVLLFVNLIFDHKTLGSNRIKASHEDRAYVANLTSIQMHLASVYKKGV